MRLGTWTTCPSAGLHRVTIHILNATGRAMCDFWLTLAPLERTTIPDGYKLHQCGRCFKN